MLIFTRSCQLGINISDAHGLRGFASFAHRTLTEELLVSILVELPVLIATVIGLLVGGLCIYWARVRPCPRRGRWGCRLFVATLVGLGGVALFAAFMRADGLAPLGLLSGLLTVCMLWESPAPAIQDEP